MRHGGVSHNAMASIVQIGKPDPRAKPASGPGRWQEKLDHSPHDVSKQHHTTLFLWCKFTSALGSLYYCSIL